MTSVAVDVATVHLPEDARDTAVTPPPSVTLIQQDDSRQQPTAGALGKLASVGLHCPPEGHLSRVLTLLLLLSLTWGSLWGLFGDGALPRGHYFSLLTLVCAAYAGGQLVRLIRLPPLLEAWR